jgi:peptidoglycan/xylan/chitin deacetylase (PgdA/CDA1 family)
VAFLKSIKKRQLQLILFWNSILTLIILGILVFGTFGDRETENIRPLHQRELPIPSDLFLPNHLDSLFQIGKDIRSAILSKKVYNLNIPLQKGWILNIWQNDRPILSQTVVSSRKYQFPISLDYGQNILRIAAWDSHQKVVFADEYEITYRNPTVEILRHPVERGNQKYAKISLTFDGGADASGAEEISNALESKKVRTTIFLTGQFIQKFPEFVIRMVSLNQEIANHTYNHPHLTTYNQNKQHITLKNVNRGLIQKQLVSTDSIFFELTGRHMAPFWRAPYGEYNQQILDWAAECGYRQIKWTKGFDTFDWVDDQESSIYKSSKQVFESIVKKDEDGKDINGAIVLMHLGSNRIQDQVYKIVPDLINELESRGYMIVPISELINF